MKLYDREMLPATLTFTKNLAALDIPEEVKKVIQTEFNEVMKVALKTFIALDPTEYQFTQLEPHSFPKKNATTPELLQFIRNELPPLLIATLQGTSLPKQALTDFFGALYLLFNGADKDELLAEFKLVGKLIDQYIEGKQ